VTIVQFASYNVHACVGNDGACNPGRVARVLHGLDCDVIGLQEVDTRAGHGHESMQLDYLAHATGLAAVPGLTILRHDGHFGNALLTRFPVRAVRRHDISHPFGRRERRGVLDADLEYAPGQVVRTIVTHFGLVPRERRHQARALLGLLHATPDDTPLVVLGDINEWWPAGRPLRWLHESLGKAPATATFPSWWPLLALDRIWVRPLAMLHRLEADDNALTRIASDHLPVRASIALPTA